MQKILPLFCELHKSRWCCDKCSTVVSVSCGVQCTTVELVNLSASPSLYSLPMPSSGPEPSGFLNSGPHSTIIVFLISAFDICRHYRGSQYMRNIFCVAVFMQWDQSPVKKLIFPNHVLFSRWKRLKWLLNIKDLVFNPFTAPAHWNFQAANSVFSGPITNLIAVLCILWKSIYLLLLLQRKRKIVKGFQILHF